MTSGYSHSIIFATAFLFAIRYSDMTYISDQMTVHKWVELKQMKKRNQFYFDTS